MSDSKPRLDRTDEVLRESRELRQRLFRGFPVDEVRALARQREREARTYRKAAIVAEKLSRP